MGIFACHTCGYTMEKMVSSAYRRKMIHRIDFCQKCDKSRRFYFLSPSGCVGSQKHRPLGFPGPSKATLYWRKMREGKTASAPLDAVCKKWEY